MAEPCGFCRRSFLRSRKINESLKCACQRPFFSQTVARNNLPTDQDCWIEVPKRFVRHYSCLFGEIVNFEGDNGRSYCCSLVGSDLANVGYGFEWYNFARSHKIGTGDQVVFTLMEKSHFLVHVYRSNLHTVPQAVKIEPDVDVEVTQALDWLQAKARRRGTNISGRDLPTDVPVKASRTPEISIASDPPVQSATDGQSVQSKSQSEDAESENAEIDVEASSASTSDSDWSLRGSKRKRFDTYKDNGKNDGEEGNTETSGATPSEDNMTEEEQLRNFSRKKRHVFPSRNRPESRNKRGKTNHRNTSKDMLGGVDGKTSKCTQQLFVPLRRDFAHHWAEPGTTRRKTYVSRRRSVTDVERERALSAAKACSITHESYLRQLEKDNCYRALILAIPAPWWRENMPQTKKSFIGTLVDDDGNSWKTRFRGTEMFWGNFTLDHCLEEDDVVVMEQVDSRLKNLKFLVHIFRVVDVRLTVTGKEGWAVHYDIVEGDKKNDARKHLQRGKGRLKTKCKRGSSHSKIKRGSSHSKVSTSEGLARESSHKRLTRSERARAAVQYSEVSANVAHDTEHSEDDSDNSLPLQHARDSNCGDPTASKTDRYSKLVDPLPREVKIEMMEEYMDSEDGGPTPSKPDNHSKCLKALPTEVKPEEFH